MKTMCMKMCLLLFSLITLGSCEDDPEVLTGNIIGKVTDSATGEVMQGVTVTITPGGTSRTTGSDGYFEFRDLEPKQYEIQARKSGYTTNNKTVNVITGRDMSGDIQLTPEVQDGKLALSVNSLNFGSQNSSLSFSIMNNGNKSFNWNISGLDKVNWLSMSPTTGTLGAGKSNAVTVTLHRDRLTEYSEATILVNADNESVALKITAEVESKTSKIQLSTNTLNFGTEYSSLTFDVKNIGNAGDVNWDITGIDADWIKVTPVNGTTAMGKSSAVKVDVNRGKMEVGKHSTTILVNADGESLRVTINAEKGSERYLEVTPSALVLGTNESASISVMSHNGATAYKLYADGDFSWALFNKTEGVISEYNSSDATTIETITCTANRTGLAAGDYSFTLIIRSDLGDYDVPVTMTVEEGQSGTIGECEIIPCCDNLSFTLLSCTVSGTTATLSMKVTNNGPSTMDVRFNGGTYDSYAYDNLGNKYNGSNLTVSLAGSDHSQYYARTDIPSEITTNMSIKIYNVDADCAVFNNITIKTTQGSDLVLKNVKIEGRKASDDAKQSTTGTVTTCNDNLEFILLDCVAGANYTTLSFRVTNIGKSTTDFRVEGGTYGSYTYDDLGNKYDGSNLRMSLANIEHSQYYASTDIPAGIMTYGSIRLYNMDKDATELANVTLKTNQGSDLVFKNVKIRK